MDTMQAKHTLTPIEILLSNWALTRMVLVSVRATVGA